MKLVLLDIDGTILWTDGAGRRAMESALTGVFGSPGAPSYRYDGKTDGQIVRELMTQAGHSTEDVERAIPDVMQRYLGMLESELTTGTRRVHVFPGVLELIDAVDAHEGMLLGLLTGNLREGASLKLRAAGIDPDRFVVGAFGSDHHLRPELPGIARVRACELLGRDVAGDRVVVIGDTPADIACGRAIGARAIGVATGHYSVEDLSVHGAAAVFADLTDTDAVMRAILDA
ncbi:MAG: haloacid dehalogenase-like hydrolase [Gemmatimonadota bacterium]|nr:haloacid dehalogenase-like hydrolase [Gemmatimonadota bacterium]